LWRYRDQRLVRLVKIAQYWPSPDPNDLRGHSAVLAIHALDWRRRKLAYVVNQPGEGSGLRDEPAESRSLIPDAQIANGP
jgi:transposase